jgi:hypothetical protein
MGGICKRSVYRYPVFGYTLYDNAERSLLASNFFAIYFPSSKPKLTSASARVEKTQGFMTLGKREKMLVVNRSGDA